MQKKYRILDNGQDSNSNALEKEMENYYKSFPKKEFEFINNDKFFAIKCYLKIKS